jgi:septum formation protein
VAPARRFVLASSSVARLRVLRDAGFDPEVSPSEVDETVDGGDTARAVASLAERKGRAVAARVADALVLACDSLLDVDGVARGKPEGPDAAARLCRALAGGRAELFTGHWLTDTRTGATVEGVEATVVRFGPMSEDEIQAYVATGEPLVLAGAFSLEGFGGPFVDAVDGSPSNVLGLSLPLLRRMLAELGVPVQDLWRRSGSAR